MNDIPGACLASSAIRCRFVEMVTDFGVPVILPSNGSTVPAPASLHGVRWETFPRLSGTIRRSDFSLPFPPHFVLLRLAVPPARCCLLRWDHSFLPGGLG